MKLQFSAIGKPWVVRTVCQSYHSEVQRHLRCSVYGSDTYRCSEILRYTHVDCVKYCQTIHIEKKRCRSKATILQEEAVVARP